MPKLTANKPATPLPWQIGQEHTTGDGTFYNANTIFPAGADVTDGGIAHVYGIPMNQDLARIKELASELESYADGYRDAAYIVTACNAMPGLVEALRHIASGGEPWKDCADVARVALHNAGLEREE